MLDSITCNGVCLRICVFNSKPTLLLLLEAAELIFCDTRETSCSVSASPGKVKQQHEPPLSCSQVRPALPNFCFLAQSSSVVWPRCCITGEWGKAFQDHLLTETSKPRRFFVCSVPPSRSRQRWLQNFSCYYCKRTLIKTHSTHVKAPSKIKIRLDLLIGRNLREWQIKGRTKAKPLNNKSTYVSFSPSVLKVISPSYVLWGKRFPTVNAFQKFTVSNSTITQETWGKGVGSFSITLLGGSTSFNCLSVLKYKARSLQRRWDQKVISM